jgi:UPF0755 protein
LIIIESFFNMKIILLTASIFLLLIASCAGWLAYTIHMAEKPGPLPETSIVLIERGKGVSAIARTLEENNVISSALDIKIVTALENDPRPLKAGEYEFTAHISVKDALEMMREGKVYERKVTLPEGVTSWQVVETLRGLADMSGEIAEVPADGTLLPQTYHYIRNDDRAAMLARMGAAMEKTLDELWAARVPGLPFDTKEQALTLASIVEKETGVPSERAMIAGVFVNRLKRGMPLQSDPTVIYAMTKGQVKTEGQGPIGRRLLSKDLSIDSPYNTYLYAGLPPGPIANPGRESIEAVLKPEVNDYIYFVADGTGGHVFAKTLAEHNRNVAAWRRIKRQAQ